MPDPTSPIVPLTAERSPWLRGPVRVPGDRFASVLALILAGLARGESVIENLAGSPAAAATIRVLGALGVPIARRAGRWHAQGLGVGGLLTPDGPLDLAGAGPATPLLIGLLAAHDFASRLTNVAMTQDIVALLDFLLRNGVAVEHRSGDLMLRGPRFPIPLDLALSADAGALKVPLLLAALVTAGTSALRLAGREPDPAESTLAAFGARLSSAADGDGRTLEIEGLAPLRAQAFIVPGDPALAAYPAVAALIAPDSEVTVEALSLDRDRFALIDALQLLGGDIELTNLHTGGKLMADLATKHSPLKGAVIPAGLPIEPEDFAILAVAAAFAEGETVLEGLGEGARRLALTRALRANGIECEEQAGGLAIRGQKRVPGGGNVTTRLDPKLAMAFLVLGMAADKPVTIDDGGVMAELFPDFVSAFEHIGGSFSSDGAR